MAVVLLSELSRGMPVEGTFRIINPLTREEAGQLVLGMGWHNPLRLPGEAPAPPGNGFAEDTAGAVAVGAFPRSTTEL